MHIKNALLLGLATALLILAAALGVVFYRSTKTVESWLQYVWFISIAFAFIGYLCRGGAATGNTVEGNEAVLRTSHDSNSVNEADLDNARAGIAFGIVVMLTSLVVFGAALAALCVYFP